MAVKTFYIKDAAASGSSHGSLQDGGSAPATSTTATGFTVAKNGATLYRLMVYASEATTFTSTAVPGTGGPSTTSCFRSENTLTGTFANTNWTIAIAVRAVSNAASGTGRLRVRVWKSANATGTSPTELTSAVLTTTSYSNLLTSADQNLTVTWSPGATKTLTNEYLFVEVACETQTASGSNNADALIRTESTNSKITTSDFTAGPYTATGAGAVSSLAASGTAALVFGGSGAGAVSPLAGSGTALEVDAATGAGAAAPFAGTGVGNLPAGSTFTGRSGPSSRSLALQNLTFFVYDYAGNPWVSRASAGVSGTLAGGATRQFSTGAPPSTGTSLNGKGLAGFDGTSANQLTTTYGSSFTWLDLTSWTMTCLFKASALSASGGDFYQDVNVMVEVSAALGLSLTSSGLSLWQTDHAAGDLRKGTTRIPISTGNWYWVVGTYDSTVAGGTLTLWVNGVVETLTGVGVPTVFGSGLRVGASYNGASPYFQGEVALVAVDDDTLSIADIERGFAWSKSSAMFDAYTSFDLGQPAGVSSLAGSGSANLGAIGSGSAAASPLAGSGSATEAFAATGAAAASRLAGTGKTIPFPHYGSNLAHFWFENYTASPAVWVDDVTRREMRNFAGAPIPDPTQTTTPNGHLALELTTDSGWSARIDSASPPETLQTFPAGTRGAQVFFNATVASGLNTYLQAFGTYFEFYEDGGVWKFFVSDAANTIYQDIALPALSDGWHSFVVDIRAGADKNTNPIRIYVDGVLVVSYVGPFVFDFADVFDLVTVNENNCGLGAFTATGDGEITAFGIAFKTSDFVKDTDALITSAILQSFLDDQAKFFGAGNAANSPLAGSGVALEVDIATGSAAASPLAGSGAALKASVASGSGACSSLAATATATLTLIASGGGACSPLAGSGSALEVDIATGAAAVSPLAGSGSAVEAFSATGASAASPLAGSGSAVEALSASGASAASPLAGSGAALEIDIATGAAAVSPLAATGVVLEIDIATGAATVSPLAGSGNAILGSGIVAVGDGALSPLAGSGSALEVCASSGSAACSPLAGIGTAVEVCDASGNAATSSLTITGVALEVDIASGAAAVSPLAGSGTAPSQDAAIATGSSALSPLSGSGDAILIDVGSGSAAVSPLAGTGAVTITEIGAGSGAVSPLAASGLADNISSDRIGSGGAALAPLTGSGVGAETMTGSGTSAMSSAAADGSAQEVALASGTATAASLEASGSSDEFYLCSGFGALTALLGFGVGDIPIIGSGSAGFSSFAAGAVGYSSFYTLVGVDQFSLRRFYLLKSIHAKLLEQDALASAWLGKRHELSGHALPDTFPYRVRLMAAGYIALEDLDGATTKELQQVGFTPREAAAVFAAMRNQT